MHLKVHYKAVLGISFFLYLKASSSGWITDFLHRFTDMQLLDTISLIQSPLSEDCTDE